MNAGRDPISARRTLDRLKRGVPPLEGVAEFSIGMERLIHRVNRLLAQGADRRWFAITSEYGEGKSHSHSLARCHASSLGYAVTSLDVNRDEGALHMPQRQFPLLMAALKSPMPFAEGRDGFYETFRHWLDSALRGEITQILQRMQNVAPAIHPGWDYDYFQNYANSLSSFQGLELSKNWAYPYLLDYLSGRDLTYKASYARVQAGYRLQLIQEWLIALGHNGLLLFIDEVDNVIRQIHARAYPGCFRTLAWYCASPALHSTRVIFAGTPEIESVIRERGPKDYLDSLRAQTTVREEEIAAYRLWLKEVEDQAWLRCPKLSQDERVALFERIANLHKIAWGSNGIPSQALAATLAAQTQFRTPRRWVRAAVQILDTLQQNPLQSVPSGPPQIH